MVARRGGRPSSPGNLLFRSKVASFQAEEGPVSFKDVLQNSWAASFSSSFGNVGGVSLCRALRIAYAPD